MTRWQYQTLKLEPGKFFGGKVDIEELQSALNDQGQQGWELVSASDTSYPQGTSREVVLILKRPAP